MYSIPLKWAISMLSKINKQINIKWQFGKTTVRFNTSPGNNEVGVM